jgi:protein ImuA
MIAPDLPALVAANDRTVLLQALRERLAQPLAGTVRAVPSLPFGLAALDRKLPGGGLAGDALHEIVPQGEQALPAAFGFLMALMGRAAAASGVSSAAPLILVLSAQAGFGLVPYGHGLAGLGLDPARLMLVRAGDDQEALWALEEALRVGEPAAVAGLSGRGLDLKASRRLQLAAGEARRPLFLLRPDAALAASAAATRWRIQAAPGKRDRFGLLTSWRWEVALERCRNGQIGEWIVEWDHGAHRFGLAAALAGAAVSDGAEACARVA